MTDPSSKISIALYLRDGYSKSLAKGKINVSIKASGEKTSLKALLNSCGYYNFLDLPVGNYTIRIKSEHYLDEVIECKVSNEKIINGEVFDLIPGPAYPFFSAGETLVRGNILDESHHPVSNADIYSSVFNGNLQRRKDSISEDGINYYVASKTDSNGEFVLFFGPLIHDMITDRTLDGSRGCFLIGPEGTNPITKIPLLVDLSISKKRINFDDIEFGSANIRRITLVS